MRKCWCSIMYTFKVAFKKNSTPNIAHTEGRKREYICFGDINKEEKLQCSVLKWRIWIWYGISTMRNLPSLAVYPTVWHHERLIDHDSSEWNKLCADSISYVHDLRHVCQCSQNGGSNPTAYCGQFLLGNVVCWVLKKIECLKITATKFGNHCSSIAEFSI